MNWLSLLSGVPETIGKYFTRKMEIKAEDRQQERAVQKALTERKIELISQGLTADMNWEMAFANEAANTWKDEFELLVLTIPLVMCFVPGLAPYVLDGFNVLAQCPSWFLFLVISVYLANYGIRYWRKTQSDT